MKLFGIAGWSGSGKTTLLKRLIPELEARGVSVSTIKHAHHAFDIDLPGKDSYEHRRAGAREVLIASANRWAIVHELRGDGEPPLATLLAKMTPVDLVLIEGYKRAGHEKLEVHRPSLGKPPLHPDDPKIVAVASDEKIPGLRLPCLALDDVDSIAEFVLERCGLARATTRVV
jgi:molybdopterin-guanine dinucleotide biosynthesis protein MobB